MPNRFQIIETNPQGVSVVVARGFDENCMAEVLTGFKVLPNNPNTYRMELCKP